MSREAVCPDEPPTRQINPERGIAGEAENVVGMVVFCPFHRLDPAVVAVAAPHDAGLRPMTAQA